MKVSEGLVGVCVGVALEEKGGREVEAGRGWWGSYARRKRLRQGVAWWARGGEGEGRESRQRSANASAG